jgi:gluconolactonase
MDGWKLGLGGTMAQLTLELVTDGLRYPEGPVAMADGSVVLTEIEAGCVTRVTPDGKKSLVANTGGGPNGLAIGPDGALYVTNDGGSFTFQVASGLNVPGPARADYKGGLIQRIDLKTGEVAPLYTHCGDRILSSPDDLVFDRQGGFWFTAYGVGFVDRKVYGGLFYATPDGKNITCARAQLLSPNGVGLSPDETVVYVADTLTGRLWAFDIASPGQLKPPPNPLAPGRVIATLPGLQLLDSLKVEAGGVVGVATLLNGGITTFTPDGTVEHFDIPDPFVSNLCFGGADMRDAWITASGTGRLYKTRWPRPGLALNFSGRPPAVPARA